MYVPMTSLLPSAVHAVNSSPKCIDRFAGLGRTKLRSAREQAGKNPWITDHALNRAEALPSARVARAHHDALRLRPALSGRKRPVEPHLFGERCLFAERVADQA